MQVRQGHINRRKRSYNIAVKMFADYTNQEAPLTVEEIAYKYKKRNGRRYSRQYIYQLFKIHNLT